MAENIIGDIISKEGRSVKFGKELDRICPVCGKGENPNKLHIRSIIENTAEIECPSCGYSEHVPAEQVMEITDILGRPVNR